MSEVAQSLFHENSVVFMKVRPEISTIRTKQVRDSEEVHTATHYLLTAKKGYRMHNSDNG